MIRLDPTARRKAADLVEALARRQITNVAFERAYPSSRDRAVGAVYWQVWFLYDDLHEHRLDGRHALTPEAAADVERLALFLRTDLPYRWPLWARSPILLWFMRRIGKGDLPGDLDVWPFLHRSDLEAASASNEERAR